eukprot:Pompholyxophrys_punicea_v1_NODE_235_length_2617_cov_4.682279.p2 type:complete len:251 gc:universal NODE_235_length_2617_cov_4.682279:1728-2480(+)
MKNLRALIPRIQVLAVTATAHELTQQAILASLGLRNVLVTEVSPIRTNVTMTLKKVKEDDFEQELKWILQGLREIRESFPRGLIFCRTIYDLENIFTWFESSLKKSRFSSLDDQSVRTSLIDMFHAQTPEDVKDIIGARVMQESTLRVVVCSIAFGMGLDTHGFRWVVHWGLPPDVDSLVQETSRVGRDGQTALSYLYSVSGRHDHGNKHLDSDMKRFLDHPGCRVAFLRTIYEKNNSDFLCGCCDFCRR